MEHIRKQLYYRETWKRRLIFTQSFLIFVLIAGYVFVFFRGISETAHIQSLTARIEQQKFNYRERESAYLGMLDDVTLAYAYTHGFVEADAIAFVTTGGDTVARLPR